MRPTSIRRSGPQELTIEWTDGHRSVYPLEVLRDHCPCAGCSGETVLFQQYVPPPPDRSVKGRYDLTSVTPVGSYAVQLEWGDGHQTGIYTWEHLRKLCPCPEHRSSGPS